MTLYYVFAGPDYYPYGGAGDCQGIFASLPAARKCLQGARGDWGGIFTVEPDPARPGAFHFVAVEDE